MKTVKKFHQFVRVERGPVNSVITDLLSGAIFHVSNDMIDLFEAGSYDQIDDFIEGATAENLVMDIDPRRWIPANDADLDAEPIDAKEIGIELHIEEGVDIQKILNAFGKYPVFRIFYYGDTLPPGIVTNAEVTLKQKNFARCVELAGVDGNFGKAPESILCFNKKYNSCWGTSLAFTADSKIRPCIHSLTEIGSIDQDLDNVEALIEQLRPYWEYNKDKVARCRDCEFRYVCFDCREIALRNSGELDAHNPLCPYNPYTGEWEDQETIDNKKF